jgi:hypothetical protein
MTKAQEIQAYHAFIQSLPEASYIRPWLTEVAVEVETLIRSDIIPDLSPRKAQLAALELRQKSLAEAKEIIESAENDAAHIRSVAQHSTRVTRHQARAALRALADSL